MAPGKVPQPGPAKLTKNSGPDEWLKCALNNQYLPEAVIKKLCEMCKELLMEGELGVPLGLTVAKLTYNQNLTFNPYLLLSRSAEIYTANSTMSSNFSALLVVSHQMSKLNPPPPQPISSPPTTLSHPRKSPIPNSKRDLRRARPKTAAITQPATS